MKQILLGAFFGAILTPLAANAEWILVDERKNEQSSSVIEIDDNVKVDGTRRFFNHRTVVTPNDKAKPTVQMDMGYVANCSLGEIVNVSAIAFIGGRQMNGPPSEEIIRLPNKSFDSIYQFVCAKK